MDDMTMREVAEESAFITRSGCLVDRLDANLSDLNRTLCDVQGRCSKECFQAIDKAADELRFSISKLRKEVSDRSRAFHTHPTWTRKEGVAQ